MNRCAAALAAAAAVFAAVPLAARAQAAPAKLAQLDPPPAAASGASGSIDPEAATRAYLARQTSAEKARSDAYSREDTGSTCGASSGRRRRTWCSSTPASRRACAISPSG